jgi:hypothetical protein
MSTVLRIGTLTLLMGSLASCADAPSECTGEGACAEEEAFAGEVAGLELHYGDAIVQYYTANDAWGRVNVSASGPGLECEDEYLDDFQGRRQRVTHCRAPEGVSLRLHAEPQPGYAFAHWNKCWPLQGLTDINAWNPVIDVQVTDQGSGPSCEAFFAPTAQRDRLYARTFGPPPQQPPLTPPSVAHFQLVDAVVVGAGTVSLSVTDGTCTASSCQVKHDTGAVTLTATPAFLNSFAGWSGCSSSTSPTLTLQNVTSAQTCTATFKNAFGF